MMLSMGVIFMILLLFLMVNAYIPKQRKDEPKQKEHVNMPLDKHFPCPFCNLERCGSMGFCYIEKHRLHGRLGVEHCEDREGMTSLVRDPLVVWAARDACQPAIRDHQIAYCWCANVTEETEEDKLRAIRIWRYQSVKERSRSGDHPQISSSVYLIIGLSTWLYRFS